MTSDKRLAAEHLFDAFGELDDTLLASAMNYKKPKAKILRSRPFISAVSAVAAVLVLAVLIFPRMLSAKDGDMSSEDKLAVEYSNLTSALAQADYSGVTTLSSTDEVDLFDGQAKIIWQYTDSDVCYVVNITESDLKWLTNYAPGTDVPDENCRIWLTAGDGLVVSPCLKQSAGNVGYGDVFSYSPEVDISPTFANYLTKLIT